MNTKKCSEVPVHLDNTFISEKGKQNQKPQIQNTSHLKILSKLKNAHSCSPVPDLFPAKFCQASLGRNTFLKLNFILWSTGAPTTWTIDRYLCIITIHKHLITLCKYPCAAWTNYHWVELL